MDHVGSCNGESEEVSMQILDKTYRMCSCSREVIESEISDLENNEEAERHCAFCLKPGAKQLCSGCHRRAYCSRECQVIDWPSDFVGQGHQRWCQMEYGEEDLDWFVTKVVGKGLGILAKRTIPPGFRIIVEPVYTDPEAHGAISHLQPRKGNLREKFHLNSFPGEKSRDWGRNYIALRMARINHSCDANAGHNYCETSRVEILYAIREIQTGEEICINYRSFKNLDPDRNTALFNSNIEFKVIKDLLRQNWGIVCPRDCVCNKESVRQLVLKGRKLAIDMERLADLCQPEAALKLVPKLMAIHDQIHSTWIAKANSLYTAFQIAVMSDETLEFADEYITKVCEIHSAICPFSKMTEKYKTEKEDPSLAINYRRAEFRVFTFSDFNVWFIMKVCGSIMRNSDS